MSAPHQSTLFLQVAANLNAPQVDVQFLAKHFDFKTQIQLQVGLVVNFREHFQKCVNPTTLRPKKLAFGTRSDAFDHKWDNVQQLLLSLVEGLEE